jgi:ankyrin repeat protein
MDQLSKLRQANQLESRLGKLPKTLNIAYAEIFQNIEDGDRETLERAVKWIMCAREPLETKQILRAVQLSVGASGTALYVDPIIAEETLLDICNHLIIKDATLDHWTFPHASVIEYFEEVHKWDIGRAHSLVAKICLLYLIDSYDKLKAPEAKEDAKTIESSKYEQNDPQSPARKLQIYVRNNWHLHVLALEKSQPYESEVSKLLQIFLGIGKFSKQSSQQYQRWFEDRHRVYSLRMNARSDRYYTRSAWYFQPIENPIFGICVLGFCNLLKDYWMSEIDILQLNEFKLDLLSIAACHGHLDLCEKLIELGSNVNRQLNSFSNNSNSALCAAVHGGHIDTVKFLLSKGADPNLPLMGSSALCASMDRRVQYTGILLEAKADLNRPCGPRCPFAYPIERAAAAGDIEKVKFLLNHGANVDLCSESGDYGSALTAAAYGGTEQMCLLLLDHGADANASLRGGKYGSALAVAARDNELNICRWLIKHGADVNAPLTCGDYGSALAAAVYGGGQESCRLLIEYGADVNASLKSGNYGSALATAAYVGEVATCRLLVENKADVNASLEYGKYGSALGAALVSDYCRIRTVKYLIEVAHADASILSTTSPEISRGEDTTSEDIVMSIEVRTKKTTYLIGENLVERNVLLRIGFNENELPPDPNSIIVPSLEDAEKSDDTVIYIAI